MNLSLIEAAASFFCSSAISWLWYRHQQRRWAAKEEISLSRAETMYSNSLRIVKAEHSAELLRLQRDHEQISHQLMIAERSADDFDLDTGERDLARNRLEYENDELRAELARLHILVHQFQAKLLSFNMGDTEDIVVISVLPDDDDK